MRLPSTGRTCPSFGSKRSVCPEPSDCGNDLALTRKEGGSRAMFATRRSIAAVLLAAWSIGVGILTWRVSAAEEKEVAKPAKSAEDLPALLKARVEVAQKEYEARKQEYEFGRGTLQLLFDSANRLLTAHVELSNKKAHQVATHEDHLRRMKDTED